MCVKLIIGAIAGLLGGMPVLAHADDGRDDPFINTIGDGYPIAIDTVEYPNGAHYNNHPNRSTVIGHWIVGRGHESDAKTLKFLDPANELWKQYGTKASFSQSASSFHKYVTTKGIVG